MAHDEYETVIGKLVLLKLYLVQPFRDKVDELIEEIEQDYIERRGRKEV